MAKWRRLRVKTKDGYRTFSSQQEYDDFRATESAKKLAKKKGVSLDSIEGSGEGGRVLKSDVEKA